MGLSTVDPVPYLDILGVAEGCILIVCASLPTLGPLVRTARNKISSSMGQSRDRVTGDSGQGGSDWSNIRGHKLGNVDDEGPSSNIHASVDDIPLVSSSSGLQNKGVIHKTTEFELQSEDLFPGGKPAGR
jgi:hypothetical protein